MPASNSQAVAVAISASKSVASRRLRPSEAKVRSVTQPSQQAKAPAAKQRPAGGGRGSRQDLETLGGGWPLDDLLGPMAERGEGGLELLAGIRAVGEHMAQPEKAVTDRGEQRHDTVAVPGLRRGRLWMLASCTVTPTRSPPVSVTMWRLRPLTFLPASPGSGRRPARGQAPPRGPPAPVVFTLWLSMIPADGLASRPAASHAASSRAWWMRRQVPSSRKHGRSAAPSSRAGTPWAASATGGRRSEGTARH